MEQKSKKSHSYAVDRRLGDKLDLNGLLHPAQAFAHPSDIVHDEDLTLNEKRAVLASWASDACAIEANPSLRRTSAGKVVSWDDIMDALRTLDWQAANSAPTRCDAELFWWPRRGLRRRDGAADHEPQLN